MTLGFCEGPGKPLAHCLPHVLCLSTCPWLTHSTGCGFPNCAGQGCSLVLCEVLEQGSHPQAPLPASPCALQGGCLGMDDSQPVSLVSPGRAPAGTKRPIFIYPRAQAVLQEPPPPPSPRHQERAPPFRLGMPAPSSHPSLLRAPLLCSGTSLPSQGGWMVLGQHQELGSPPRPCELPLTPSGFPLQ